MITSSSSISSQIKSKLIDKSEEIGDILSDLRHNMTDSDELEQQVLVKVENMRRKFEQKIDDFAQNYKNK